MAGIPARVADRIKSELKRIRPALQSARERDVNESDTGLIVAAILADVLGYDRFLEVTSEYAIRSTFCDLAVKIDGKLKLLIEVKAIGLDLKDGHLRQAVDYAANQGVDWVILTNGAVWRAYRVMFTKPINCEIVFEADLLDADPKDRQVIEKLYLVSREGVAKQAIASYHEEKQATSRFMIGALLQSDPLLEVLRREIRRTGGVKVECAQLREVLRSEVLKRDVVDGEQAAAAESKIRRAQGRALRQKERKARGAPYAPGGVVDASTETVR